MPPGRVQSPHDQLGWTWSSYARWVASPGTADRLCAELTLTVVRGYPREETKGLLFPPMNPDHQVKSGEHRARLKRRGYHRRITPLAPPPPSRPANS